MLQRFLDPATLASISSLDLVAKTVVDGFVAGLHRSPDFGFSSEFAEYRAYSEGDDLRHVDWNVFARTDKCFLKRYRGETNSQLLVLLDTSASMGYGSRSVTKLDYAEAQDDYVALASEGKKHLKQQTISSMESSLDPDRFLRIHRSYVVNLERVTKIEPFGKDTHLAILSDGTRLPVSRSGYGRLRAVLDRKT